MALSRHEAIGVRRASLRRWWDEYRWVLLGLMWLTFLSLGYAGIAKYFDANGIQATGLDILYRTIQLVVMDSIDFESGIPIEAEIARFALPTLAALTAITALTVLFFERMQTLRLKLIRNHVVICGLGQEGSLLARSFIDRGYQVVIVDADADNPRLPQLRELGVITLIGSAAHPDTLLAAGINRAASLVAVCGDDRLNAEIAFHARQVTKPRRWKPLHCLIHIVDSQLYEFLINVQLASQDRSSVRLEPFNIYDRGAKLILQEHPPYSHRRDPGAPLLLLVGLGRFGQSVMVQAARVWFMRDPSPSAKMKIIAVDRDARQICETLSIRYPQLAAACDFAPFAVEFDSPAFHRAEYLALEAGDHPPDMIYICLDDDSLGLSVVQSMLRHAPARDIPIIIRTRRATSLAGFLSDASVITSAFRNIRAFSLLDQTLTPDLLANGTHEMLARALHEEYIRHLQETGTPASDAAMSWSLLPESLRESNRKQVDRIASNLEAVGCRAVQVLEWDIPHFAFTAEEINRIAELEHEGWCDDLRKDGWRFAPGPRNRDSKTHPSLVDWRDLPETEREKNRSSARELSSILSRAGFRIERVKSSSQ